MKRIRRLRPSPALIVAIVALVAATAGTSFAFGLSALSTGAKNKTVGVGKLTYVTTSTQDPAGPGFTTVVATCPSGLKVIGGGIKGEDPTADFIFDSYPTSFGWSGRVFTGGGTAHTFITTAICAKSRVVTGSPPAS